MSIFKRSDLDAYVVRKERRLGLLSDFSTRRDTMWKIVIAEYFSKLQQDNAAFLRSSTFDLDPVLVTGTPVITTDINDVFKLALADGAVAIAEDHIWIYNDAEENWVTVPRTDPDEIQDTTETAFYELNGELVLYIKKATLTIPAEIQYNYWRKLDAEFVDENSLLDIQDKDFTELADRLASLMLIGTD